MNQATEITSYLGDGLYAKHDGYHIVLETKGGLSDNKVFLEPEVVDSFLKFVEKVRRVNGEVQSSAEV